MTDQTNTLPKSFWVITVIAIIWNVMGVYAYLAQVYMSEETLAAMPDAQRELTENTPGWLTGIFAIAVFAGLVGSIGLAMRKAWAIPAFLVSLVAIIIQMGYSSLMTNALEVLGVQAIVGPIILTAIGACLLYYSKQCKAKGWLA